MINHSPTQTNKNKQLKIVDQFQSLNALVDFACALKQISIT